MTTITPFLWFEGKAEEAMAFYASVFKDSRLGAIKRFGDYMPGPKGRGNDRQIHHMRSRIHGVEWWPKWRPEIH